MTLPDTTDPFDSSEDDPSDNDKRRKKHKKTFVQIYIDTIKSRPIQIITIAITLIAVISFLNNQPIQISDKTNTALENKISDLDKNINNLEIKQTFLENEIESLKKMDQIISTQTSPLPNIAT